MRLLLTLMLAAFSGQVAAASVARRARPDLHTALIFANAYGDTVWFQADTIAVGPDDVLPLHWGPPKVIVGQSAENLVGRVGSPHHLEGNRTAIVGERADGAPCFGRSTPAHCPRLL